MGEIRRRLGLLGFRPLFGVVLLAALIYMLPTIRWMAQNWNTLYTPTWVGTFPGDPSLSGHAADIDTWFIHGGLAKAPHFRDTWQWWVGTWAGQVPFYRPLTSMVFWAEWQLCGDREPRYVLFALGLHLLVTAQFARTSLTLFRRFRCPKPQWAMLLASLVFVDGLYSFPTRPLTNSSIFALWKNQPDSLCAFFFLLALNAYLQTLPAEAPPLEEIPAGGAEAASEPKAKTPSMVGGWGMGWAAFWFAASCLSKEAGVFLPLLLLYLESPYLRGKEPDIRRRALRRLLPQFAVLFGFLALRAVCLAQMVGFRYGDNSDWGIRLINELFGPLLRITYWHHPLILLLGFALVCLFGWRQWKQQAEGVSAGARLPAIAGILILSLLLLGMLFTSGGLTVTHFIAVLKGYASHITVSGAIGILLFVLGVGGTIIYHRRLAGLGGVWVAITLVFPLLTPSLSPFLMNGLYYSHYTNLHRYYLVEAGFALLIGGGLILLREQSRLKPAGDRTLKKEEA